MTIFEKVTEIIANEIDATQDRVTLDASIKSDLGIDGIDVMNIMLDLEDELGITMDFTKVEEMETISELVAYVEELTK